MCISVYNALYGQQANHQAVKAGRMDRGANKG
jgi:hypothetical protein